MTIYRIYGKEKGTKIMRAFDFNKGVFVGNLIYASFFYEDEYEKLVKEVDYMNENNPDYIFEIRKVKN